MKTPTRSSSVVAYSRAQPAAMRTICEHLRSLIVAAMPDAKAQVWHGSPVWFIDENPVVGYSVNKQGVALLFWNGRAFDSPDLRPVGKHGAAQAVFGGADELDATAIRRWLKQAKSNVFDSRAYFAKLRAKQKRSPRAARS